METHSYNQEPDLEDMTEMGVNTEEELTVDPLGSDNHLPGVTKPLNYGHQEGCICPPCLFGAREELTSDDNALIPLTTRKGINQPDEPNIEALAKTY